MQINEKIRAIRKQKKLTQEQLHERLKELFGPGAIDKRTLQRIEKGRTDGRASSLHQICVGLDISIKELFDNIEAKETTGFTRWDTYHGQYVYNEKAFAEIMSSRDVDFLVMKLHLNPKAVTRLEKDPEDKKYIKWLYVLRGTLTLHVENQQYILKQNQCATFYSFLGHSFENSGNKKTVCIIMQYPRHI